MTIIGHLLNDALGTSQLRFSTYWQEVFHWKPLHVAVAILPQGVAALMVGGSVQGLPKILNNPRPTIAVSGLRELDFIPETHGYPADLCQVIMTSEILQALSRGGAGGYYWRYCFPAFVLGSAGAVLGVMTASINLITYCPPEMAGVAGAWFQVLSQVGGAFALAVQSGFERENATDWLDSGAKAYWFILAWVALIAGQYVLFFRKPGTREQEHEATRERMKARNRDMGVISA